jgi:release factor glutamine methyltransferase
MSIKKLLREGKLELERNKISTVDAELLISHLLGIDRMQLHKEEIALAPEELVELEEEFSSLIHQRTLGSPTQYLIGSAPFRHLTFDVGPGVLIPRPESEGLVELALREIEARYQRRQDKNSKEPISVIDLGAGSGALAISLASEANAIPLSVIAVENSPEAITWLERNISRHEVDIRVVKSSVADALIGVKSDVVIANPPYIPDEDGKLLALEVQAEPESALFGGLRGLEQVFLFLDNATRLLKRGGALFLEHHESQRPAIFEYLSKDFIEILGHDDLSGRNRYICAIRK